MDAKNKCVVNSQSQLYLANYPSLTQSQPSALFPRHGLVGIWDGARVVAKPAQFAASESQYSEYRKWVSSLLF